MHNLFPTRGTAMHKEHSDSDNIHAAAMELAGCSLYFTARTSVASKKTAGRLCLYINNAWMDTTVTNRLNTPDL